MLPLQSLHRTKSHYAIATHSREGHLCGNTAGTAVPAGMDLKMQSHPAGRSGMVMLLSGTVRSGFMRSRRNGCKQFLGVCICNGNTVSISSSLVL